MNKVFTFLLGAVIGGILVKLGEEKSYREQAIEYIANALDTDPENIKQNINDIKIKFNDKLQQLDKAKKQKIEELIGYLEKMK